MVNLKENKGEDINKFKNPTFIKALKNALRGVKLLITKERNIKIQLVAAILVTILGILFKISITEWCILVITMFLVLITEGLNTAVEKTVDMITEEYSECAKNVKDIAAGAVLLSAISSVIIGIIIFLPKILIYIY